MGMPPAPTVSARRLPPGPLEPISKSLFNHLTTRIMKIIKIVLSRACIVALLCGCGAAILSGCGKKYLDVNNNPNAPTTGASVLIFTNAEAQTAATINGADFFDADYFMSYKSLVYLLYNISRNDYTSNDFTAFWSDCYHNLQDYATIESASRAS